MQKAAVEPTKFAALRISLLRLALIVSLVLPAISPASAHAAITYVQGARGSATAASVSATFPFQPTAGNLLVAIAANRNSATAPDKPVGWSEAIVNTISPGQAIYYRIAGVGEPSLVTVGPYPSSNVLGLHIYEWSGIDTTTPVDATGQANATGSPLSSGTATTTVADALLMVGLVSLSVEDFGGWTNSFTERSDFNRSDTGFAGGSRVVSSTGFFDTEISQLGGAAWRGQIVAFKGAVTPTDSDGDGLWDNEEDANLDADGDPATNPGPDTDGDTIANYLDSDDDDDGTPTASENADPNADGNPRDAVDSDWDGQPDYLDNPTGNSNGTVTGEQKISDLAGGFAEVLVDEDQFGKSVAAIGDLDGDGVNDLVASAWLADDGGNSKGEIHVLFLNADGTVKNEQKISDTSGGLTVSLAIGDRFGASVAALGDIDGDGVTDIAVGADLDDDGGSSRGALYILFLNPDGTVKSEQKISDIAGGLAAALDDGDRFGAAAEGIGDLDGDGVNDVAVGAQIDGDGGVGRGAVYILFLNPDGTVKGEQKISDTVGGLTADLDDDDNFGNSLTGLGDVDGDGVNDIAVGTQNDDDGGSNRGAIYVLFMNPGGTVKSEQKISDTAAGLSTPLDDSDKFGSAVAGPGDLDDDGVNDVVVGALTDDDGGDGRGAVYLLFLNPDGTVKREQKISSASGGLTGPLDDADGFGGDVVGLGDLDGDGIIDLGVGCRRDDDGGSNRGAVYILRLTASTDSDGDGLWDHEEDANMDLDGDPVTSPGPDTDGDTLPNYVDSDDDNDGTPTASENADPNGDGDPRDATDSDRDGQPDYLDNPTVASAGMVATTQKISDTEGGLTEALGVTDHFGQSVASIGDLDGDGIVELAVGVPFDDDGSSDRGAVYVLFLNADGTVKAEQKISDTAGNFLATLDNSDEFGHSVAGIGDLNGDGLNDLAVGAHQDDDGGGNFGAVYILFLNADGTVQYAQKISALDGALTATFDANDRFGSAVANLGDLDGDGLNDLAVGAATDDDGNVDAGAVYVLYLNTDGTVKAEQKISEGTGGLLANLATSDGFGGAVAGIGDVDGDGVNDLAVGAFQDDDGSTNRGAAYVLFLNANGTVKAEQKISSTAGGLTGPLANGGFFGASTGAVGDVDGDGVPDLAVGASGDGDGASLSGAAYVLFLNSNGTVKAEQKISNTEGALGVTLDGSDQFGVSVAGLGDLDSDGTIGLAVGVYGDDDGGPSDRGALYVLDLATPAPTSAISGTVFEDIVGDVLADGAIGDANNPGASGVDVYLYRDNGNSIFDGGDTVIAGPVATDANGAYSFNGLSDDTYFVRVDSRTIPSAQDPAASVGDLWAVQTYATVGAWCASGGGSAVMQTVDGPCYGGVTSILSDSAGAPLHYIRVTLSGSSATNNDLGFSFNVVVGTRGGNGADDDGTANRTVQGSLRQFIQNANAIDGPNAMRFVPVDPVNDGTWWDIAVSNALPTIADDETTVDGTAYDLADGSTLRDTNTNGPEFEIDGSTGGAMDGLTLTSAQNEVRALAIGGFDSANQAGIRIDGAAASTNQVAGCYVGLNAEASDLNANYNGIVVTGPSNTIGGAVAADRNVIAGNTANGVFLDTSGADGNVITGNYFGVGPNGTTPYLNSTGIMVAGATNNTIGGATPGERNVIAGNTSYGVYFIGAGTQGNAVQGNYIGVNATGAVGIGSIIGVYVSTGPQSNVIGGTAAGEGNVISSNNQGVTLSGANTDLNLVLGNLIGTDAAGTAAVANGIGVRIVNGADNNRVGGSTVAERNVISGNTSYGVIIDGGGTATTGNTIVGNFIGTAVNGTDPLGNGDSGIRLFDWAQSNTIGGTDPADRNVISANLDGIYLQGPATSGNLIQGNFIGTDAAGTSDLGNLDRGVQIESGADNNTIGGTTAGAGNVISGNDNGGMVIGDGSNPGTGATGNVVQGNHIGTDHTGTVALGNEHHGVQITTVDGNSIGGIADGAGNIIAHNTWTGVLIQNSEAAGNEILRNSIHTNGGLGIDLGDDGVTANNGTKNASLSNEDMDFPVFTTATLAGTNLTIAGYVGSAPSQSVFAGARVEVFEIDGDGGGYGEGLTYLGFLTADGNGDFSGTIDVTSKGLVVGEEITGTATDGGGNTSEFGANVVIAAAPSLEISGTVFEDVDFAGTATDWDGGTGDVALPNVDVELYDGGDSYLASVVTAGDGTFSFTGLGDGAYKVRVRSATIGDADTPPAGGLHPTVPGTWPYPLPDMTWGHGSALIGGQDSNVDDTTTADNAGPGDTWIAVTVSGGDVTGVNLGFCYDVITNNLDDANADSVRSMQGCLRQFIKNSNAITGVNKSWFQIPSI